MSCMKLAACCLYNNSLCESTPHCRDGVFSNLSFEKYQFSSSSAIYSRHRTFTEERRCRCESETLLRRVIKFYDGKRQQAYVTRTVVCTTSIRRKYYALITNFNCEYCRKLIELVKYFDTAWNFMRVLTVCLRGQTNFSNTKMYCTGIYRRPATIYQKLNTKVLQFDDTV